MSAVVIRNLPEDVHATLRRVASERHTSVEALARKALADLARSSLVQGINFAQLSRDRAAMGFAEDGPVWDDSVDDPALSRKVLGLE
jgi:plasmid stability protein